MKRIPSPPSPKKVLSKNVKSYSEESGKLFEGFVKLMEAGGTKI